MYVSQQTVKTPGASPSALKNMRIYHKKNAAFHVHVSNYARGFSQRRNAPLSRMQSVPPVIAAKDTPSNNHDLLKTRTEQIRKACVNADKPCKHRQRDRIPPPKKAETKVSVDYSLL